MGSGYSTDRIPDLKGKVCVITGANTGIGRISALELARKGAHVILACRSKEKAEPVVQSIKTETGNNSVEFMELDLSSLKSVKKFTEQFKSTNLPLHLILNTAGIMATPFWLSADGIEAQFATNHLGHFLLTNELLGILEANTPSRIVNLSSMAHNFCYSEGVRFDKINDEQSYSSWSAYGQSKLCNILFTKELAKRLGDKKVYVNAVHPGYVATELGRNLSQTYGSFLSPIMAIGTSLFAKSPQNGALTSLYVATDSDIEKNNWTGEYFVPTAKHQIPSSLAGNPELAKKLWEFSEKLIQEKLGN